MIVLSGARVIGNPPLLGSGSSRFEFAASDRLENSNLRPIVLHTDMRRLGKEEREKVYQLRIDGYSLQEICEITSFPKGTTYYWIRDIPLQRVKRLPEKQVRRRVSDGNSNRYRALRDQAYKRGLEAMSELSKEKSFRDFVLLYMTEGYRKSRNTVAIANSNPALVILGNHWIKRLSTNKLDYTVQYHSDNDVEELKGFWSAKLGINGALIRFILKSNSGNLQGRKHNCPYGVMSVRSGDTYLRSQIQAWMDTIEDEWKDL